MENKFMKRRRMLDSLLAAAPAPVALTALGKFGWGAGELLADNSAAVGAYPAKYPQINHPGIPLVSVRKVVESLESIVILCQAPALEVLYVDIEEPLPV